MSGLVASPGGTVAPGYERVAEAFERNFAERGELGASFAACVDGELVVDLRGGIADEASGRPWREDALQLIFSGTKGLTALCVLMLADRGRLSLEDRVCDHWPEFAAAGKDRITVAEVLSHRARLPGVRAPLASGDLTDGERLAGLLAGQAPEDDPRAAAIYHPLTYGWLCGELVRRVDGRSVGRLFAEEVAEPLGLELWIGLPEEHEARVSTLVYGPGWGRDAPGPEDYARDDLLRRSWANPLLFPAERMPWNTRAFHGAEIPGASAIGSARSIARLYGCLARGGELDGVRLLREETLALGRRERSRFTDPLRGEPLAFAAGFQLQTDVGWMGPPADAFGHSGAGGSVHGAWPRQRAGFSYAMNQMRDEPAGDPRSQSLLRALFDALQDI